MKEKKYTFLIDKESVVYKESQVFCAIYVVLFIAFLYLFGCFDVEIGMFWAFFLCLLGMFFGLEKSMTLWRIAVKERTKRKGFSYSTKGYVFLKTTILYFLNYVVLSLMLPMVLICTDSKLRGVLLGRGGWLLVLFFVVGTAIVVYGRYLERHSASLFSEEPPVSSEEYYITENQRPNTYLNFGYSDYEDGRKSLLGLDFLWLFFGSFISLFIGLITHSSWYYWLV